jgi:hypothetical protein
MHTNLQMGVLPCLAHTDLLDAVSLEDTTEQLVRVVPDFDSEGQRHWNIRASAPPAPPPPLVTDSQYHRPRPASASASVDLPPRLDLSPGTKHNSKA